MNLRGSQVSPKAAKIIPADLANRVKVEEAYQEMAHRRDAYLKYHETDAGRLAAHLADQQIEYLQHMLCLSVLEFCRQAGIVPELEPITRAEYRGELKAWKMLKLEPERLQRLIAKEKGGSDQGQGAPRTWEPLPKEV